MVTITAIENAICNRLREGLGGMATEVVSWDVMTDDVGIILSTLPGVFVTFNGITASQAHDTRRTRYKVAGRFSVFVADCNLRENEAVRHGDVRDDEPGCYRLIRAVRRLLTEQDMGLEIQKLRPSVVRMVNGKVFAEEAVAMYECVFDTMWFEDALENRHWPQAPADESDPDHDFVRWAGRLDTPYPDHVTTHADYIRDGEVVAEDTLNTLPAENNDADS
ncbi:MULTISPECIES: phage protein Gp37 [Pantoea]|uniref:DUF1834 family protein n=1 Tax=Candidatus Pantoea gossypiicola TaxID=2608008 RepID=A0AB34CN10_9GAMM|nr:MULTISPECIES: phage protein Gp37 [Pantoea]KAA5931546.1 DUF1834 family protein [Pantoea sp. VH_8]KAA5936681.1 DUF1834 family protein [Pantoea sp. VH_4]KAA5987952.1 DUF1834 family protein [Pantoea sp. M_4]KAA6126822.1 DUF1834 family protein [Pantoea gossypiicola]